MFSFIRAATDNRKYYYVVSCLCHASPYASCKERDHCDPLSRVLPVQRPFVAGCVHKSPQTSNDCCIRKLLDRKNVGA